MISQRLNPRRPVQVINAGVPGYDLENNLGRLEKDILPLRPDMIISYHGINGFHLIAPPPMQHYTGPARKERPISLLADCELRLKLMLWDHRRVHDPADFSLAVDEPMETAYARAYRQLVQCAQTNHFRLVVANFSMAVNSQSDPDLIRFYSHRFPTAAWDIRANEIHSSIVRQSALQHPDVIFVDTHPHLDGEHDKFIDLVHFTQAGRQQLAETFFAAIRTALKEDLDRATPDRQTKPTE
jgi:lysophospholipase L1-like esterase